jgi:hypothetical protein
MNKIEDKLFFNLYAYKKIKASKSRNYTLPLFPVIVK